MDSEDDMDSWQTAARAPVDVSHGVIPSWLEAALPAAAAALSFKLSSSGFYDVD